MKMRLSVTIPKALHKCLKNIAEKSGLPMASVINLLLSNAVTRIFHDFNWELNQEED